MGHVFHCVASMGINNSFGLKKRGNQKRFFRDFERWGGKVGMEFQNLYFQFFLKRDIGQFLCHQTFAIA